ncbi:MAG: hypothetical protein NUW37_04100 [Planctomycetes bacterium]|nr:hypothetical protein [Planctomycetota bacterium]
MSKLTLFAAVLIVTAFGSESFAQSRSGSNPTGGEGASDQQNGEQYSEGIFSGIRQRIAETTQRVEDTVGRAQNRMNLWRQADELQQEQQQLAPQTPVDEARDRVQHAGEFVEQRVAPRVFDMTMDALEYIDRGSRSIDDQNLRDSTLGGGAVRDLMNDDRMAAGAQNAIDALSQLSPEQRQALEEAGRAAGDYLTSGQAQQQAEDAQRNVDNLRQNATDILQQLMQAQAEQQRIQQENAERARAQARARGESTSDESSSEEREENSGSEENEDEQF